MSFKKYSPAVVCGFGAAVFSILPGVDKAFGCCLFLPAATGISLILYKKINAPVEKISGDNAFLFGLFTGIFAALFSTFFDTLITFFLHSNQFVEGIPQTKVLLKNLNLGDSVKEALNILEGMASDIKIKGFSLFYTIVLLIGNLFAFSIFGVIGGFLSMYLINKRSNPDNK
jgi:hypothetical protein